MRFDPRRNLAATTAGVLGVALFVAIEVYEPTAWYNPLRLLLFAAGIACLIAGGWPTRRVRLLLLLGAAPAILIVGFLALMSVGIAILPVALIAGVGLFVEYAREGRA